MKTTSYLSTLLLTLLLILNDPIALGDTLLPISTPANTPNIHKRLWNLQEADIHTVIDEVAHETGKNFLVDPRVEGKVSIISSRPIDKAELYQVFLSILQVHGYAAIPNGDIIEIIPRSDAKHQGAVSVDNKTGRNTAVTAKIIPLKNISAAQIVGVLRPLLPPDDHLASYAPTNTLIIASTAENIERINHIVEAMDHADNHDMEIISLRYATASKVTQALNRLQLSNTEHHQKATLVADERTNSIMISGTKTARLRLRAMIARLDNPHPDTGINATQVIYLQYQKAKDLAPILNKIVHEHGDSTETSIENNNAVYVQAEPTANALIVHAAPTQMHTLQEVIKQLDKRPAQVLVEAAIVEMDDNTAQQLGIQWGTVTEAGVALADSLTSGVVNGLPVGFNQGIGVIKNGSLREVVALLSSTNAANILSTPTVVVVDNQQAKIEVGKTVSIETGAYSNTSTAHTVNPFTTFQRDNIGLHLYVTPQITQSKTVKLNIDQGNETLENPTDPGTTPVTNTSSLKTTVLVNTGDILVLGGIISNAMTESNTKIPLVGDIPVVGKAFQFKHHRVEKKNLMIFLKPLILRNAKGSSQVTEKKYSYIRNEEIRHTIQDPRTRPTPNDRILPRWEKDASLPMPFTDPTTVVTKNH
ncbi:MAG: type II secretion system secretin GspD [Gammaproteobacteria bacterium]